MSPLTRQLVRWGVIALVWAGAIYLLNRTLLSQIDWGAVATHGYTPAERFGVAAFVGCFLVAMALRALRFHLLMNALQPLPAKDCVTIHLWGFAIGAITPLRMGEGVRLIWARRRGIATGEAVVVWVVERMADFATLLAIVGTAGAAVLLQRMIPGIGPGLIGLALAGLVALAAVALVVLVALARHSHRLQRHLPVPLARQVDTLGRGAGKLVRAHAMGRFALLTALIWTAMASAFWLGYSGFFDGLGPAGALLLLGLVNLSFLLAFLPGHVLGYHAVAAAVLAGFGASPEQAAISAIVIHAVTISVVLTLGGVARLARLGLRLDQD